MGLDMYLTKKTLIMPDSKNVITVSVPGLSVAPTSERICSITEEVGYWRKANAIHKWFLDNVQKGNDDCGEYRVSKDRMKQLLSLVTTVLADHAMAETLLPTQEGFFFGSTDYDSDYFDDLQLTREILTTCIREIEEDPSALFYYQADW